VRKRIFPFLVTSKSSSVAAFGELDEERRKSFLLAKSRIDSKPETLKLTVKPTAEVSASSSSNVGEADANADHSHGSNSVIAFDHVSGIGLALFRLENLKSVHELCINEQEKYDVVTFRPHWWKDVDPVTGQPLI
jgi:hypothetical protein